jgi:hypothetical protein
VGGYNDLVEYLKPKDVEKVYAECAACGGWQKGKNLIEWE